MKPLLSSFFVFVGYCCFVVGEGDQWRRGFRLDATKRSFLCELESINQKRVPKTTRKEPCHHRLASEQRAIARDEFAKIPPALVEQHHKITDHSKQRRRLGIPLSYYNQIQESNELVASTMYLINLPLAPILAGSQTEYQFAAFVSFVVLLVVDKTVVAVNTSNARSPWNLPTFGRHSQRCERTISRFWKRPPRISVGPRRPPTQRRSE